MSEPPIVIREVISPELAQDLIRHFHENMEPSLDTDGVDYAWGPSETHADVLEKLATMAADSLQLPCSQVDTKIVRYGPGGACGWHTDRTGGRRPEEKWVAPQRIASFSLLLNDDFTGGVFKTSYGSVDLHCGDMVAFTAMTEHIVYPVKTGERFVLIGFCLFEEAPTVRVVVPHMPGKLHKNAEARLKKYAPEHIAVELDPHNQAAYRDLLADEWQKPGDLVVIEQDIGIHDSVLPEFAACPEPFCVHEYRTVAGKPLYPALGCTRFSEALKVAVPDLWGRLPVKHWALLDREVGTHLGYAGYVPHTHQPSVIHYLPKSVDHINARYKAAWRWEAERH